MNANNNEISNKKQDVKPDMGKREQGKLEMGNKIEDLGKKTAEAADRSVERGRESMMAVNSSFMKAFDQNRSIMQHLMRAMQEESLRFVNMRFEHTSRAIERSRELQGMAGLISLQQDWFMDAARDFAEFNKRCGEALHEVAEHGIENMQDFATDAVHHTQKSAMGDRAAA